MTTGLRPLIYREKRRRGVAQPGAGRRGRRLCFFNMQTAVFVRVLLG
nr:MAG TPA: hypothetical protein [Caudoviricetes sp.]